MKRTEFDIGRKQMVLRPALILILLSTSILLAGGCSKSQTANTPAATPQKPAVSTAPASGELFSLCSLGSSAAVISLAHHVTAYAPSGDLLWSIELPNSDTVDSPPVPALSSVTYVRGVHGIYAIAPDGKILWQAKNEDPGTQVHGLAALGDSTVAVTHGDNALVAYSNEGLPRWTFKLPAGDKLTALPVSAPNSYVYLRGMNSLYAVDGAGMLVWAKEISDKAGK
jgi:PQQ-like domain